MMDERVHPLNPHADDTESVRSSKFFASDDNESLRSSVSGMESCLLKKPRAAPGSYVIQIPKDQIYRLPPPENAHLFDAYTRRGKRSARTARCCCCVSRRCLVRTSCALALVLLALATAAGVLYFVSRPRLPAYTVDSISIRGFNLTGSINPEIDLAVRADNRNKKIGIDYRGGGTASVAYSSVALAGGGGAWPAFYQGTGNVTVVAMALKGSGVRLPDGAIGALRGQRARGRVPLEIDAEVPVRAKLGSITSWAFKVRVKCDVVVDDMGSNAKVVSESCRASAAWR
ncbi:putative protein YLS9 [Iris pallida]|uniref:Late embryogenesis abundant protein LEA-2 subgroup domain-containing protein n=1 Tax=Iris pallida TaxID=29817 RepID=A0AAX6HN85_IRIPA|nr:putative protein YLS9 [Iris pallida]